MRKLFLTSCCYGAFREIKQAGYDVIWSGNLYMDHGFPIAWIKKEMMIYETKITEII